jgi:hypothetical protein
MCHAFLDFSARFDPEELKESFDRTLDKKPLFNAMNQLKYWQLYCDLYPIMTQAGSGQFPQHFGEEFVRTYEKQISEFKRIERVTNVRSPEKDTEQAPLESTEDLIDQVDHGTD